jgi:hypothetical protein
MSDTKRSTAEFQRTPQGDFETMKPGVDASASRLLRKPPRTAAAWQGADERGGDPYNATGRHVMLRRTPPT